MNVFKALMKREYWEHKGSVFYTPAVLVAIFVVLTLVATFTGGQVGVSGSEFSFTEVGPKAMEHIEGLSDERRSKFIQLGLHSSAVFFGIVLLLISIFYALGSLYDERKDRSILFWKSLPISDTSTVLSKFLAITIMAPLFYFAAICLFQVFLLLYVTVAAWFAGSSGIVFWTSSNLFGVFLSTLVSMVFASLWLAPLWGWLMLMSAWAKKVAFLWGFLPLGMIMIGEYWVFGTARFALELRDRIVQGFFIQNSYIQKFEDHPDFDFPVRTFGDAVQSSDFWVGLLVAGVLLAGAIFTRRYRDES